MISTRQDNDSRVLLLRLQHLLIILVLLHVSCNLYAQKSTIPYKLGAGPTAVVITGGAAKISQEVALLQRLNETGWLKNVGFISGASSGALNTVMLNAILNGHFTWDQYLKILFNVHNNQVFIQESRKLPVNTDPLRGLLTRIIQDSLGYSTIGDLPIPSAISATSINLIPLKKKTLRFSNRWINPESDPAYNLVDVLMASTAIPVVFPMEKIRHGATLNPQNYIDGGIADDHIPYEAVLQYQQKNGVRMDKLVIISRKMDTEQDIRIELSKLGLKDTKLLERLGLSLQRYSAGAFYDKLLKLQMADPELASRTYIYIPEFSEEFPLMDFGSMKSQYYATLKWAEANQPVPLAEYLSKHNVKVNWVQDRHKNNN